MGLAVKAGAVFIYALVCPLTLKVRYVGQSTDPRRRIAQHISARKLRVENRKNSWIRVLLDRGLRPTLIVLQEVTDGHWAEAERAWIVQGRMIGWPLTNSSDGGEGVLPQDPPPAPERRRRGRPAASKARPPRLTPSPPVRPSPPVTPSPPVAPVPAAPPPTRRPPARRPVTPASPTHFAPSPAVTRGGAGRRSPRRPAPKKEG